MFLIRILLVALLVSYLVWLVCNYLLSKPVNLLRVILYVLLALVVLYFTLWFLSLLIEGG